MKKELLGGIAASALAGAAMLTTAGAAGAAENFKCPAIAGAGGSCG